MLAEAGKRCGGCGENRPLSDFCADNSKSDRLQSLCRQCHRVAHKRYRRRVGRHITNRADKYGLRVDEVKQLILIPVCQACGAILQTSHAMKFDHCHRAGHFRGVLCNLCNTACAGRSQDAIVRLQACIDYLKRDLERIGES